MFPKIIKGGFFEDERGVLKYNNEYDAALIRRIYIIENKNKNTIRGWQGHKIQQRWFTAIEGTFNICLMKIENWSIPSNHIEILEFSLDPASLDILFVPPGYISSIQSKSDKNKLLVMADYTLNEIQDEYKFPFDYFV